MKKIIHMVGTMNLGGQETLIMNVYNKIDRNKYQFDFIVQSNEKGFYDDEIKRLGGKIHVITRLTKNPVKHILELRKILKNDSYCAFHRHTNSSIIFIDLVVAKLCKIKNIIVHSHSTHSNRSNIIHYLFRPFINWFSTHKIACSHDAGKFMFGKSKFEIINNGIDVKKFIFNNKVREKLRKKFNFKNTDIVIGHVGRFTDEKNHEFIIKMFDTIRGENDKHNYYLLLIGDGPNRDYIEQLVNESELDKCVSFLGNVTNVYDYLQCMDLFVFPSKYEGLGISLIEAQAAGLNCLIGDVIPKEAILTDHVFKYSLDDYKAWSEAIKKIKLTSRKVYSDNDLIYNYDINKTVSDFCTLYEDR